MHVHHVGIRRDEGHYLSQSLRHSVVYRYLLRNMGLASDADDEALEAAYTGLLVRHAHEEGAPDKSVILALDWVYDEDGERDEARSHMVVSNEAVFELCRAHERLLPAASVNPARKDAIEALEEVWRQGAVLIKLLPNLQGFDPADPRFRPFWRRMAELGLPLLSHTGYEHALPTINDDYGDPARLTPALEEGCTVIAAHCAAAGRFHQVEHFNRFVGLLHRYKRLYGDISGFASPIRGGYLAPMLASRLRRSRTIFGSDFPIPCMAGAFIRDLGLARTRALQRDPNPLRRNLHLFEALGVDEEITRRGARLLLGEL